MSILIIGGTGFIGQRLVRSLYSSGNKITLLVRPSSMDKAQKLFADLPGISYLRGDIENTDLLSDVSQTAKVSSEINCLVHLAASYQLDISPTEAYLHNVVGTQNVLKFAARLSNLKHFHYFSTYAVNQLLTGKITEDQLIDEGSVFYDQYARSKNHAEHLIRKMPQDGVNVIIHRPGIIVGDSQTGNRDKNDGPYYFFDFIKKFKGLGALTSKIKYLPLPVQDDSLMPVLPVDVLIEWSTRIILNPMDRPLSCYHLVPQQMIRTKDFLQLSIDLLKSHLKIICVPIEQVFPPVFRLLKLPQQLVFYMKSRAILDQTQLMTDYPQFKAPDYQEYLPVLIKAFVTEKR